jgi:hypothetical protein
MTAEALLSELARRGVALRVENGKLRWKAPRPGVVTEATVTLIRAHKEHIIRLLRAASQASAVRSNPSTNCEADDRRALHEYAKHMGFPHIVLAIAGMTVEAGEQPWRRFARRGGQYELWEAAIGMIEMEDAGGAR